MTATIKTMQFLAEMDPAALLDIAALAMLLITGVGIMRLFKNSRSDD